MRRTLLTIAVLAVALSGAALAAESKDETSKDIPLAFVLEKTNWDGDDINIWGTVKNTGKDKYKNVKVVFTVRSADGAFIGRHGAPNQMTSVQAKLATSNIDMFDARNENLLKLNGWFWAPNSKPDGRS